MPRMTPISVLTTTAAKPTPRLLRAPYDDPAEHVPEQVVGAEGVREVGGCEPRRSRVVGGVGRDARPEERQEDQEDADHARDGADRVAAASLRSTCDASLCPDDGFVEEAISAVDVAIRRTSPWDRTDRSSSPPRC